MVESVDAEIRKAFHHLRLNSYHKCPNTIVIDELGLAHGKNRIDIAVVNGCIHGFEIKSSRDNLSRLPEQLAVYSKTLEKLSIISAPNHFDAVMQMSPDWCGLILVEKGIRGGIKFKTIRRADKNPSVDLIALSHLLWRKEAIELLKELGVGGKELNGSRLKLYTQLSELVSAKDLTGRIKKQFMSRENWRVVQQP